MVFNVNTKKAFQVEVYTHLLLKLMFSEMIPWGHTSGSRNQGKSLICSATWTRLVQAHNCLCSIKLEESGWERSMNGMEPPRSVGSWQRAQIFAVQLFVRTSKLYFSALLMVQLCFFLSVIPELNDVIFLSLKPCIENNSSQDRQLYSGVWAVNATHKISEAVN